MTDRLNLPVSGDVVRREPQLRRPAPRARGPRSCRREPRDLVRRGDAGPARHHGPRAEVRRRRDHGRGPAGHGRVHRRRRPDAEGLRRRRLLARSPSPGRPGRPIEMVKLFQLELEHYEKLTGDRLSLEGKANRLAQMIRSNFPLAMQGLVVVPLFGGFDARPGEGRIFYYDATGGRWEEDDYQTTGSGSAAGEELAEEAMACRACPATRRCASPWRRCSTPPRTTWPPAGPIVYRKIFPNALAVTAVGRRRTCPRTRSPPRSPPCCEERGVDVVHAVRRARADDEGPLGVRPQGHRARPVRDRDRVRGRAAVHRREPVAPRCTRSARSTTASRSRAWASTASSRTCASPASGWPTCAATPTAART